MDQKEYENALYQYTPFDQDTLNLISEYKEYIMPLEYVKEMLEPYDWDAMSDEKKIELTQYIDKSILTMLKEYDHFRNEMKEMGIENSDRFDVSWNIVDLIENNGDFSDSVTETLFNLVATIVRVVRCTFCRLPIDEIMSHEYMWDDLNDRVWRYMDDVLAELTTQ